MAQDLWQIRRKNRMTIDELARRSGIPPGLIKAYELGQRPITEQDLVKLANALMVEPWEIKELSDPPPRGPSRYGGTQRYGLPPAEEGGSRYGDRGSRYGNDMPGSSRYGNDVSGGSRYDRDSGSSRYDGDYGRSRYGGERSGGSRYDSDLNRGRYSSDRRYDRDAGPPRSRPSYRDRGNDYGADRRGARPKKARSRRRQPAGPARPTQIEHLKTLLVRLDMSGDDLLRLAGKPLSMLNRKEAAQLLTTCQNMLAEQKPPHPKGKRQRPYLPESVDEHELIYLTDIQTSKRPVTFTLFNGDTLEGTILGFSPYALTITQPDGMELTVQKLAIAYYQVEAAPEPEPIAEDGEDPEKEVEA